MLALKNYSMHAANVIRVGVINDVVLVCIVLGINLLMPRAEDIFYLNKKYMVFSPFFLINFFAFS